jgi:hypothetical protein
MEMVGVVRVADVEEEAGEGESVGNRARSMSKTAPVMNPRPLVYIFAPFVQNEDVLKRFWTYDQNCGNAPSVGSPFLSS